MLVTLYETLLYLLKRVSKILSMPGEYHESKIREWKGIVPLGETLRQPTDGIVKNVNIKCPISIIPSDNYPLVIMDRDGVTHYFLENGDYDGWSKDVTPFEKYKERHHLKKKGIGLTHCNSCNQRVVEVISYVMEDSERVITEGSPEFNDTDFINAIASWVSCPLCGSDDLSFSQKMNGS